MSSWRAGSVLLTVLAVACAPASLTDRTGLAAPAALDAARRAAGGDLRQQHLLAYGFRNGGLVRGIDFPKRPDLAVAWLKRAAEQGDRDALFWLALATYSGKGVARSATRGFDLMRRAAELGDARAQISVSISYRIGAGVARDPAHAERWFQAAVASSAALWRRLQARRLFVLDKPPLPDSARLWYLAGVAICTRQLPSDGPTNERLLSAAARSGDPEAKRALVEGAYLHGRDRRSSFCHRRSIRVLS